MGIQGAITMALFAAGMSWAGEPARPAVYSYTVAVCSDLGAGFVISKAQTTAAQMFKEIGVRVEWHSPKSCPADAIHIDYSYETPPDLLPVSLAYAKPYEGIHIVVFFDRVQKRHKPGQVSVVLAHVMVHEITHILQGVQRHSDTGVMKATWTRDDVNEMSFHPLAFADEDVNLIHKGIEARGARMASLR